MSFLGHLCTETSVGCLRKETCRAASPGLRSCPSYLNNTKMVWGEMQILMSATSVSMWGWMWGFHREARCDVGASKVQRHHRLHLCNQIYLTQENPNSCSIWTPRFCHQHFHSNTRGGAYELSITLTSIDDTWEMTAWMKRGPNIFFCFSL